MDYFSCLGVDLCFDEMTLLYLNKTINICKLYLPMSGAMLPENMSGYCAPCVRSELTTEVTTISANLALGDPVEQFITLLLTSVMIYGSGGHEFCLQTVPIITGFLTESEQPRLRHVPLYNHEIALYASDVISYSFFVHGFNSGQSTSPHGAPPFQFAITAS